jgi:hypothetical protein
MLLRRTSGSWVAHIAAMRYGYAQDRHIKSGTSVMLGFKRFRCAKTTIQELS